MLTVTTPATDLNLLTAAELRVAVGLAAGDTSRDATLAPLGRSVSAAITRCCLVAAAGATPVTLRMETLQEVFRPAGCARGLRLSRRPVVSIASVTEGTSALAETAYEVDGGWLLRLSSGEPSWWAASKVTVVYDAGWATVPDDLKLAASKLAALLWSSQGRDALLKRERIDTPGVDETEREFWVGPVDGAALPADVTDLLAPYTNLWV